MSQEKTRDKILSEEMIDVVLLDEVTKAEGDKLSSGTTGSESKEDHSSVKKETTNEKADKEVVDHESDNSVSDKEGNASDKIITSEEKTSLEEKKSEEEKNTSKEQKPEEEEKTSKEQKAEKEEKTSKEQKAEKEEKTSKEQKAEKEEKSSKEQKSEEEKKTDEEKKSFHEKKDRKTADESGESFDEPVVISSEKKGKKKGGIIALIVVLIVLLGAYFTGFWYFSSHFYQDVAINGLDVSWMDMPQSKQALDNFYTAYTLTLETVDGKNVVINGKDIDMQITLRDEFAQCFSGQKPYLWFVEIWNHHDFTIQADAKWNQEKLDALYEKMDILHSESIVPPADAYIASDGTSFVIMDEVMGNELDELVFKQTVSAFLTSIYPTLNLKEKGCYHVPKIYKDSEELNKELEELGEYVNAVVTIQMDDLTIEPSLEMLKAVLQKNGSSYTVSQDKVNAYVRQLAFEHDTYGKMRTFHSSFVDKDFQIEGKYWGYELDQETTGAALFEAFNRKTATIVDASFLHKGKTLQGTNDIGDTYIEADLTRQKVVAYKNGRKFAESDCVSGNVSAGNGTCLGLYAIQDKQSPSVLRGEMVPKSKKVVKIDEAGNPYEAVETTMEYSYESHVVYWMPFNGGYGLHDADGWRSVYGGSIYYYSGSHGCINLPRTFAEKLYENFDVGTPVLVYFEGDEKDPPLKN